VNAIQPKEMTRKVALYQTPYGFHISEVHGDPDKAPLDGWVRVSEVLEITVTPLSAPEIQAGAIRALYSMRANVEKEMGKKLRDIDSRIASLQALPAPETTP
jgi:hypothetical protein